MEILDKEEIKKGIKEIEEFCGFDILNGKIHRSEFVSMIASQIARNFLMKILMDKSYSSKNNTLSDEEKYSYLIDDFRHFTKDKSNRPYWDFFKIFYSVMNTESATVDKNALLQLITSLMLANDLLLVSIHKNHFDQSRRDTNIIKHNMNLINSLFDNYMKLSDREKNRKRQIKKATEQSAIARGRYKKQAEEIWVKNELWKYNTEYALRYYEDMIKQRRIYSNNGEDEETIRKKSIDKLKNSWFPSFRKNVKTYS